MKLVLGIFLSISILSIGTFFEIGIIAAIGTILAIIILIFLCKQELSNCINEYAEKDEEKAKD